MGEYYSTTLLVFTQTHSGLYITYTQSSLTKHWGQSSQVGGELCGGSAESRHQPPTVQLVVFYQLLDAGEPMLL